MGGEVNETMKILTPAEAEETSADAIEASVIAINVGLIEGRRYFEVRIGIADRVIATIEHAGWGIAHRSDWGDHARFDVATRVAK